MSNVPKDLPVVIFFEDRHEYWMGTKKLTSISGLLGSWVPDFEEEYWLNNAAFKEVLGEKTGYREVKNTLWKGFRRPGRDFYVACWEAMDDKQREEWKVVKERVRGEWKLKNAFACMYGSRYHVKREDADREAGGCIHPVTNEFMKIVKSPDKKFGDNCTLADNLYDLPDGYYPELLIFDPETGLCGQVDKAWIRTDEEGVRYYASSDYKTNWKKRKKGGMTTLFPPFNHLDDSKRNMYSLQASAYAYMMEKFGFVTEYLELEWVEDFGEGETEFWEVEYLHDDIEYMFELYAQGHKPC